MIALGIMPPPKKKTVVKKGASNEADDHIARMRALGLMLEPKDQSDSLEDREADFDYDFRASRPEDREDDFDYDFGQ